MARRRRSDIVEQSRKQTAKNSVLFSPIYARNITSVGNCGDVGAESVLRAVRTDISRISVEHSSWTSSAGVLPVPSCALPGEAIGALGQGYGGGDGARCAFGAPGEAGGGGDFARRAHVTSEVRKGD